MYRPVSNWNLLLMLEVGTLLIVCSSAGYKLQKSLHVGRILSLQASLCSILRWQSSSSRISTIHGNSGLPIEASLLPNPIYNASLFTFSLNQVILHSLSTTDSTEFCTWKPSFGLIDILHWSLLLITCYLPISSIFSHDMWFSVQATQ
jgi:hypothetical protein